MSCLILLIVITTAITGCSESKSTQTGSKHLDEQSKSLGELDSGYRGSAKSWRVFVECWKRHAIQEGRDTKRPFVQNITLVGKSHESEQDILALEARISLQLPRSYREFLSTFSIDTDGAKSNGGVGLFGFDAIEKLSLADPAYLEAIRPWAFEANDSSYFKYGTDQDDAATRFSYLTNAIVIGKYIDDGFGYIVLFPESVTKDGEFEAAIIEHAGEFRASSFAELMRQLSFFDINSPDTMPPYSQESLRGTCASELPLHDVWWK